MALACPRHPNVVLFPDTGLLVEMMVAMEKTAYCPKCKKSYFESECVEITGKRK